MNQFNFFRFLKKLYLEEWVNVWVRKLRIETLGGTGLDVPAGLLLRLLPVHTLDGTVGRHERLGTVALIIRSITQRQGSRWEERRAFGKTTKIDSIEN
jgi:hypothetical protein